MILVSFVCGACGGWRKFNYFQFCLNYHNFPQTFCFHFCVFFLYFSRMFPAVRSSIFLTSRCSGRRTNCTDWIGREWIFLCPASFSIENVPACRNWDLTTNRVCCHLLSDCVWGRAEKTRRHWKIELWKVLRRERKFPVSTSSTIFYEKFLSIELHRIYFEFSCRFFVSINQIHWFFLFLILLYRIILCGEWTPSLTNEPQERSNRVESISCSNPRSSRLKSI